MYEILKLYKNCKFLTGNLFKKIPGILRFNGSAFYAQNFTAKSINGLLFDDLFTLHTNQTFNNLVGVVGSVTTNYPLVVKGAVNRMSLEQEFENTVMVSEDFLFKFCISMTILSFRTMLNIKASP